MGEYFRNLVISIFFTLIGWIWSIAVIRWFMKDRKKQISPPHFSEAGLGVLIMAFMYSLYFVIGLILDLFNFFFVGK
ncbi:MULTISPECIES: hypothetical protein [unclassified Streptococcus]|uniref:hypothetical protein n=1 Tax=unclassified Streptococcus TaxID=2608887 RepID=UPI00107162D7|nr:MULTISPECIES: hypothetical protein [unclassified Streptococcus]MBF0787164.1 hypothetical protein [Streptococcus sp. 19428wC2_LYSM12]MCQ9212120.1 hypothetical protein [Streptococcus sp. B01]MCQ9213449.1 hypothetical protein [Streptococcus sp. O1]TFV05916.1 hypothetical protein E4T79_04540 [Streptococcus sp. LYSM12]